MLVYHRVNKRPLNPLPPQQRHCNSDMLSRTTRSHGSARTQTQTSQSGVYRANQKETGTLCMVELHLKTLKDKKINSLTGTLSS